MGLFHRIFYNSISNHGPDLDDLIAKFGYSKLYLSSFACLFLSLHTQTHDGQLMLCTDCTIDRIALDGSSREPALSLLLL